MKISVEQVGSDDPMEFDVAVGEDRGEDGGEDGGTTVHRVTLTRGHLEALPAGDAPPARIVEAAFHFLLDREPKEAIMQRFDLTVIPRYFPEFEAKLPEYLAGTGR